MTNHEIILFQSTSSVWRTTQALMGYAAQRLEISIHVLRVEDDRSTACRDRGFDKFQSTSSVWRTTGGLPLRRTVRRYFNPRPPCGGRPPEVRKETHCVDISIHVLRVEDDSRFFTAVRCRAYFNPRPPCGGRQVIPWTFIARLEFQSTSSVWRTTAGGPEAGARRDISIHVLRVEDDYAIF